MKANEIPISLQVSRITRLSSSSPSGGSSSGGGGDLDLGDKKIQIFGGKKSNLGQRKFQKILENPQIFRGSGSGSSAGGDLGLWISELSELSRISEFSEVSEKSRQKNPEKKNKKKFKNLGFPSESKKKSLKNEV